MEKDLHALLDKIYKKQRFVGLLGWVCFIASIINLVVVIKLITT